MRPGVNSSALHIFQILRIVGAASAPLNHAEISRRSGLPSSTVYRALGTLEEAQYVQRSATSLSYEAGIAPQLLVWTLLRRFPVSLASLPFLSELSELSGETVSLSGRIGWYGVRLSVVYGGNDIYHRDRVGEISLLHTDLSSRGIFAFLSDDEIDRYRRFVLRHHDAYAREIDRPALRREVQAARENGYVLVSDAQAPLLSIPVYGNGSEAIASIALRGPAGTQNRELPPSWKQICGRLTGQLRRDGQATAGPFSHLDPDQIVLKLPARAD